MVLKNDKDQNEKAQAPSGNAMVPLTVCHRCSAKPDPTAKVVNLSDIRFTPGGVYELKNRLSNYKLLPVEVAEFREQLEAAYLAFFAGGRHNDNTHNTGQVIFHRLMDEVRLEGTRQHAKDSRKHLKKRFADVTHDMVSAFILFPTLLAN